MYKYIKGREVLVDEHMLSATELAKIYGLYTSNGNPNGILVRQVLLDYVKDTKLNISEYYYPHGHGVMRVYPQILYDRALSEFVFNLEEGKLFFKRLDEKEIENISFAFEKEYIEDFKERVVIFYMYDHQRDDLYDMITTKLKRKCAKLRQKSIKRN